MDGGGRGGGGGGGDTFPCTRARAPATMERATNERTSAYGHLLVLPLPSHVVLYWLCPVGYNPSLLQQTQRRRTSKRAKRVCVCVLRGTRDDFQD